MYMNCNKCPPLVADVIMGEVMPVKVQGEIPIPKLLNCTVNQKLLQK